MRSSKRVIPTFSLLRAPHLSYDTRSILQSDLKHRHTPTHERYDSMPAHPTNHVINRPSKHLRLAESMWADTADVQVSRI